MLTYVLSHLSHITPNASGGCQDVNISKDLKHIFAHVYAARQMTWMSANAAIRIDAWYGSLSHVQGWISPLIG